jgi:hypothetical protein
VVDGEGTAGLIVQGLDQLDYIVVARHNIEGLDFLQLFYSLQGLEFLFHALDRHLFSGLERHRCEHH